MIMLAFQLISGLELFRGNDALTLITVAANHGRIIARLITVTGKVILGA